MNIKIKAASLSLALLSSSFLSLAEKSVQTIGYVNTAQVFQSLPQRELIEQKMQKEFKEKADELNALRDQAKAKITKLEKDGELLGKEEAEKLRVEIAEIDGKLKIKAQSLEKESAQRKAQEQQKLIELIREAVKSVAEKEGYTMVIDAQALIHADPKDDISQKVITKLN